MSDTIQSAETVADPFRHFQDWFAEAERTEPANANAMTVATCTKDGVPSARVVLLKDWNSSGFVFYTNKDSRKGNELAGNPRAALLFYWPSLGRQIRIDGTVQDVTDAEADAYFASRPRISRLGAWASIQSRPLADREVLKRRLEEFEATYPGEEVPRPPYWSGYRVVPKRLEFWQDMPFRLHDRIVYTRARGGVWSVGRIFP
jgi:pyridoxamine 5'-phosphate oxidase